MYTDLNEAIRLVKERWQDLGLRVRVEKFLGALPFPVESPVAVMARQVATPNLEMTHFDGMVNGTMPKVVLEYPQDRFTSTNPDKVALLNMRIIEGIGRNGGDKVRVSNLVNPRMICQFENNPLSCIETDYGNCFRNTLLSVS